MRFRQITDFYGNQFTINLDLCSSYNNNIYNSNIIFYFSGNIIELDKESGEKLLAEILSSENSDESSGINTRFEAAIEDLKTFIANNGWNNINPGPDMLHKDYIRTNIFSADFLTAEAKLKLLAHLGV